MQTTRTGIDTFVRRQIMLAASIATTGMAIALAGLVTTM